MRFVKLRIAIAVALVVFFLAAGNIIILGAVQSRSGQPMLAPAKTLAVQQPSPQVAGSAPQTANTGSGSTASSGTGSTAQSAPQPQAAPPPPPPQQQVYYYPPMRTRAS